MKSCACDPYTCIGSDDARQSDAIVGILYFSQKSSLCIVTDGLADAVPCIDRLFPFDCELPHCPWHVAQHPQDDDTRE